MIILNYLMITNCTLSANRCLRHGSTVCNWVNLLKNIQNFYMQRYVDVLQCTSVHTAKETSSFVCAVSLTNVIYICVTSSILCTQFAAACMYVRMLRFWLHNYPCRPSLCRSLCICAST